MKALSLWQPWATAMARGHKTIETRSWGTQHRGLVAICAARTTDDIALAAELLERAGLPDTALPPGDCPSAWPLGCVVAVGTLVDCVSTTGLVDTLGKCELAFGDYSRGRWAWVFKDIRPMVPVVPCTGAQGLFTLAPDVVAIIAKQHPEIDLKAAVIPPAEPVPEAAATATPAAKPKKPPKPDKDAEQLKLF